MGMFVVKPTGKPIGNYQGQPANLSSDTMTW